MTHSVLFHAHLAVFIFYVYVYLFETRLLQVASNESKNGSLIVFVKDIEKSTVGNQEGFSTIKSNLENLPEKVVVIGSYTQTDNRKEKVTF